MVSFKKLQNSNGGQGSQCAPGSNQVSFRDKIPPGEAPPTPIPPTEADVCQCLGDKLDIIAGEIQQTYDSGPPFNARDPITGSPRLSTQAATPVQIDASITAPSPDPNIIGFYDDIPVATLRGNVNLPQCWVIADPDGAVDQNDPFLYVRLSTGGTSTFDLEVAIRIGEDFSFRNAYQLRIRATLAGTRYRVTSENHHTTYVSQPITNIIPGPNIVTAPVANRTDFTDINIPVGLIDQTLPSIPIPNGFALSIRSSVDNPFGSKVYSSRIDATVPGLRNTILPGDVKEYYITNADIIHVAGSQNGLSLDLSVEL